MPTLPAAPILPEAPALPVSTAMPDASAVPEAPALPAAPALPDAADIPELPDFPDYPALNSGPANSTAALTAATTGRPLTVGDLADLVAERRRPGRGWRAAVHKVTGGRVNPGESSSERDERELLERIRRPVIGDYRIALLSVKGGVGKTSTTIGLGSTFASLRGDRVIAVDANPDFGTLAHRVPDANPATVRDLLRAPATDRYAEVRQYTSQAPSRLEVLGSERDPSVSEAFSANDYGRALAILRRHYNILLTDCGTGLVHGAMQAVLDNAHCLVLLATPALDGARSAWATLDWLSAHGYQDLVSSAVVVINQLTDAGADPGSLHELFGQRCRAVHVIPHDPHIARGADIDLDLLRPATRLAYRELAAMIADDFAVPGGRHR